MRQRAKSKANVYRQIICKTKVLVKIYKILVKTTLLSPKRSKNNTSVYRD